MTEKRFLRQERNRRYRGISKYLTGEEALIYFRAGKQCLVPFIANLTCKTRWM